MKVKYLFLSMLACGVMAACSNDEGLTGEENVSLEGDSYIAIQLVASNGADTRADGDFEDGEGDEGAVASTDFYFYDGAGNFVTKGATVGDIKWDSETEDDNVESISNVVVVLRGVTVTPTQVLVVLNGGNSQPVGDFGGQNMNTALNKLISAYSYEANNKTYYVMTNSAYVTGDKVQRATPITTSNLQSTEEKAIEHPVQIYVERVAAKVELAKSEDFTANVEGNIQVDNVPATLDITVNGWGLGGTNKTSYAVKSINNTSYWEEWNAENYHRSYWAEDPNYSNGNYPKDFNEYDNPTPPATEWSLNYTSYSELLTNSAEQGNTAVAYCLENTMDKTTLGYNSETGAINTPAVTHVLIAATMKVKGQEEPQTLYRYKGLLFTKNEYKKAALNDWLADAGDAGMIYTQNSAETTTTTTTYTPLNINDLEIEDKHAGKVNIKLNAEALAKTWYTLTGYDENTHTASNSTEVEKNSLTTLFADVDDADGFNEGRMYYCVPIEHLNGTKGEVGSYGVVRNHLYRLTLKKISNLGTAVWDPDEPIIPNYDPDRYYVSAQLNILAWHVVEQAVEL